MSQLSKSEYKRQVRSLADSLEISHAAARRIVDATLAGGSMDDAIERELPNR